jgi:HD-like signal output (HDOD) protein/CheY-like chemotaxis protein
MPDERPPPTVLIAEDDRWTADLLVQLVRSARCDADIQRFEDGRQVLELCRRKLPSLVIAGSQLRGLDGLELLRQLRRDKSSPLLPFFLIGANADAASVRAALPLQPTAYLTKPFEAEKLLRRLRQVLLEPGEEVAWAAPAAPPSGTLDQFLASQRENAEGAPLPAEVREALLRLNSRSCSLGELETLFGKDPQLTAQLIAVANSAERARASKCQTLGQALPRVGVVHAMNLALGVALQRSANLADETLAEQARHFWEYSQRTADYAYWLAGRLKVDAELCYTAGLLHRLGDLAVLRSLQDWRNAAGPLDELAISQSLQRHSAGFGGAMRTRWRLPLDLRQLIGAAYQLNSGVYSREALVMNLAAQLAAQPPGDEPQALAETKAARMLGLDKSILARLPAAQAS